MIGEWLRLPSVYRSKTRFYLIRLFTGFFPGWYHQKLLLKFFELFLISRKITFAWASDPLAMVLRTTVGGST
jgi:hypothetical protein